MLREQGSVFSLIVDSKKCFYGKCLCKRLIFNMVSFPLNLSSYKKRGSLKIDPLEIGIFFCARDAQRASLLKIGNFQQNTHSTLTQLVLWHAVIINIYMFFIISSFRCWCRGFAFSTFCNRFCNITKALNYFTTCIEKTR